MPDIKNFRATHFDLTVTVASMATDANLLIGRQSSEVDDTTVRALDYLCSGRITTGTNPTGGSIEVWVIAAFDSTGTAYPDVFTNGGDAARTWTNAAIKSGAARLVYSASPVTSTAGSDKGYSWSGFSIAGAFGGTLPPRFVFFVTHSTGVNLNATAANHFIRVQPVYQTVS